MTPQVRTRYAQPTVIRMSGIYVRLYLPGFMPHNNGVFILRIEDTDVERTFEGSLENILESYALAGDGLG